jgi:TonB family protein
MLPTMVVALLPLLQSPASSPTPEVAVTAWQTAVTGATADIEGPLLRLSGGKGWSRALVPELDYVFRVQYRLATPDADGAVLVRAWQKKMMKWPESGYRVALGHGTDVSGTITAFGSPVSAQPAHPPVTDGWHDLEIECRANRLTVQIDGIPVSSAEGIEPAAGYVGLEHDTGTLEFRHMRYTAITSEPWTSAIRDNAVGFRGTAPVRKSSPRLNMSEAAVRDKVNGTVVMEAVVGTDGKVHAVRLVKSARPDLDTEALNAMRKWVFAPAMTDGHPVAMIVTISNTFSAR